MIDIHAHILPGIDDGSQKMTDSLSMAELAVRSDVQTIVCTPHSNLGNIFGRENEWSLEMEQRIHTLNEKVHQYDLPVSFLPGMEIYVTEDTVAKMQSGKLIALNFTKYFLIEFDFKQDSTWINKMLSKILEIGAVPVIAHPERYQCVQLDFETSHDWVEMGCLLQINKGSLFGKFGKSAWSVAGELLSYNLASFVASDAHGPFIRTTYLMDAYNFVCQEFSKKLANRVFVENPSLLIHSEKINFTTERNV